MKLDPQSLTPIYVQIASWLEDEILSGALPSDERIYSQYQLAELFNINPATAAKGLNILADEQLVYKKRGLGMFVATDAKARILQKRRNGKLQQLIPTLMNEAKQCGITENELIATIQEHYKKEVE